MESPVTKTPQSNPCLILDAFKSCPEDKKESYQGVYCNRLINRLREDPFQSSPASARKAQNGWKETDYAYVFKLYLPGVEEHEVKMEIEDNGVLCISHKIRAEREEKISIWSLVRGNHRRFYQRIVLPDDADLEKGRAEMNNGELIITLPKYQFKKFMPRVVQVSRR